ncbi:hypothetical protein TSUD_361510 [Trifolium subterraneum]|uniref:Uncharacterized protein n=1 Tax=Trifolium subterraneum TaxID=3900 RepID=A0A2Z6M5I5_TRISU|nr:hypothetical protein TSUD_361510 [Trifolium subterraneum]
MEKKEGSKVIEEEEEEEEEQTTKISVISSPIENGKDEIRHTYTFTKRIYYKNFISAICLRVVAIELHINDRKMVPYDIEILIYVSSMLSSKYGGKKMSHLGGIWWDFENLGLDKDVTLEKMKQVSRGKFEENNV